MQPNARVARVVLTGFMGSGKSTVGPLVARSLDWHFLDCDSVLEEKCGMTVPLIFSRHGESHFRGLEEAVIDALLERDAVVIALGGGALEAAVTRDRLAQAPATHLVYLHAPLALALDRCRAQANGADRPLLAEQGRLEERYLARLPFYRAAHQTIDTETMSPAEAADEITTAVRRRST